MWYIIYRSVSPYNFGENFWIVIVLSKCTFYINVYFLEGGICVKGWIFPVPILSHFGEFFWNLPKYKIFVTYRNLKIWFLNILNSNVVHIANRIKDRSSANIICCIVVIFIGLKTTTRTVFQLYFQCMTRNYNTKF